MSLNQHPPPITAALLRHSLTCTRRAWLDVHGDPVKRDDGPPDALYVVALGAQRPGSQSDTYRTEPIPVSTWEDAVSATRTLMAQGVPGITGACLEHYAPLDLTDRSFTLRARVDRLVRLPQFETPTYAPVLITSHTQPNDVDWVQIDFFAWLLDAIQGATPVGELWLGTTATGLPRRRIPHDYDEMRLMDALAQTIALLDAADEPPVRLEAHCKACPWHTLCQSLAQMDGSVDLLYNVRRTTRANLRAAGSDTLDRIAAGPLKTLQMVKGIGPNTALRIQANARAWLAKQPVWYDALPDVCRRRGWMFDLETHEVRGKTVPWCMGWCDVTGETQIALVAPVQVPQTVALPDGQAITLVPDSGTAWDVFAAAVADGAPIFHWTGYDAAIMRTSAPGYVQAQLEPRLHDLHASLNRAVSWPLKSTSIKPIAAYLGFTWPETTDWFAAYLDYKHWLETDDADVLARACAYQRADVQSMAYVWRWFMNGDGDVADWA